MENVRQALDAAGRGKIRVNIERVFPLSQIREAHRLIESGAVPGKVILDPTLG
jgi:NADPH:quinone reductase-like Zn-dependent oxidoreductase